MEIWFIFCFIALLLNEWCYALIQYTRVLQKEVPGWKVFAVVILYCGAVPMVHSVDLNYSSETYAGTVLLLFVICFYWILPAAMDKGSNFLQRNWLFLLGTLLFLIQPTTEEMCIHALLIFVLVLCVRYHGFWGVAYFVFWTIYIGAWVSILPIPRYGFSYGFFFLVVSLFPFKLFSFFAVLVMTTLLALWLNRSFLDVNILFPKFICPRSKGYMLLEVCMAIVLTGIVCTAIVEVTLSHHKAFKDIEQLSQVRSTLENQMEITCAKLAKGEKLSRQDFTVRGILNSHGTIVVEEQQTHLWKISIVVKWGNNMRTLTKLFYKGA